MSRTRFETSEANKGAKLAMSPYSPSLLVNPTRHTVPSIGSPFKAQNPVSQAASRPSLKPASTVNAHGNYLAPHARSKPVFKADPKQISPIGKPSRFSKSNAPTLRFSARPSILAPATKNHPALTRLALTAPNYAGRGALLNTDVDMTLAEMEEATGDLGDEEGAEDDLSNASEDDDIGEYFDGKTLIAFEDDEDEEATAKQAEHEQKVALVNSLAEPYAKHLSSLKEEVIEAMEPSLQRVHLVMTHIANGIESAQFIRGGLVVYDQASDEWEAAAHQQAEEFLGEAVEGSQMRIKAIFEKLNELETKRENWWERVHELVSEAGKAGEQKAAEGLAGVEKTISVAERKIKSMNSGAGVRKSKGATEMEKLKALMLNL